MSETTKETRFTPGPWTNAPDYDEIDSAVVMTADYEKRIADCGFCTVEEDNANADLIAAAPDMYDALAEMVGEVDTSVCLVTHRWYCVACGVTVKSGQADCTNDECKRFKARAAIAKAQGESPTADPESEAQL